MKKSRGWVIWAVIAATAAWSVSVFYSEWRTIVSDSGWYTLAFWVVILAVLFWGVNFMWPLLHEVLNRWVALPIVRMLNRFDGRPR